MVMNGMPHPQMFSSTAVGARIAGGCFVPGRSPKAYTDKPTGHLKLARSGLWSGPAPLFPTAVLADDGRTLFRVMPSLVFGRGTVFTMLMSVVPCWTLLAVTRSTCDQTVTREQKSQPGKVGFFVADQRPACIQMERAMGIEPTALAWEARVLPLYDARAGRHSMRFSVRRANPAGRRGCTIPSFPYSPSPSHAGPHRKRRSP